MTASPPPRPDTPPAAAGLVPVPPEVEDLLRLVHDTLSDPAAWQRARAVAPCRATALHDQDLARRANLVQAALSGLVRAPQRPFTAHRAAGMAAWLRGQLDAQPQRPGGGS